MSAPATIAAAEEPLRSSKRRKSYNVVGRLPEFLKQKSDRAVTEGNELLKVPSCFCDLHTILDLFSPHFDVGVIR